MTETIYGVYDANNYPVQVTADERFAVYIGAMMGFTAGPYKRWQAPARFYRMERVAPGHYRKLEEIRNASGATQVEVSTQTEQYDAPVPESTGPDLSSAPTYTCAHCGGVFEFGTPDEEAEAEYRRDYPELAAANVPRDIICDDCYKQYTGWKEGLSEEETASLDAQALLETVKPISVLRRNDSFTEAGSAPQSERGSE